MSLPKLLVVDDEPEIGEYVRDVAEQVGFAATATDDPEIFKALSHGEQSVIVLDLFMPKVDGVELLRYLADIKSDSAIILMSGMDGAVLHAARELAITHGLRVVGSLTKPIRYRNIKALLKKVPAVRGKPRLREAQAFSEDELREAIGRREFVVFYQPQVDISSKAMIGVEALVRWQHPKRGILAPNMFIPLAEETGLVDDLTAIVIEESLKQAKRLRSKGMDVHVAVNVSARTLNNLDLPEKIVTLATENALDPSRIVVELTESALAREMTTSLDILTRLRMKGIKLSIDDFGTGYSSMEQLRKVPFTEIKIDRSFVLFADIDQDSRAIVEATIDLGHKLGMTVVAEGIETEGVWRLLARLGCDKAQGYLIGKPMPGTELASWHKKWTEFTFGGGVAEPWRARRLTEPAAKDE